MIVNEPVIKEEPPDEKPDVNDSHLPLDKIPKQDKGLVPNFSWKPINNKKKKKQKSNEDKAFRPSNRLNIIGTKHYNFSCEICKLKFVSLKALIVHQYVYSNRGKYSCKKCRIKFYRGTELQAHIHNTHSPLKDGSIKRGSVQCDICKQHSSSKKYLQGHIMHYHFNEFKSNKQIAKQKAINSNTIKNTPKSSRTNNILSTPTWSKFNTVASTSKSSSRSPTSTSGGKITRQTKLTDYLISNSNSPNLSWKSIPSIAIKKEASRPNRTLNSYLIFNKRSQKRVTYRSLLSRFKCKNCYVVVKRCDDTLLKIKKKDICTDENMLYRNNVKQGVSLTKKKPLVEIQLKELRVSLQRINVVTKTEQKLKYPVHDETETDFTCYLCDAVFPTEMKLLYHRQYYHIIYMSSLCDARFKSASKLCSHYIKKHRDPNNYLCCVCGEDLCNYEDLRRHTRIHCIAIEDLNKIYLQEEDNCAELKKLHKCVCGKSFSTKICSKWHQKVCKDWIKMCDTAKRTLGLSTDDDIETLLKIKNVALKTDEDRSKITPVDLGNAVVKLERLSPEKHSEILENLKTPSKLSKNLSLEEGSAVTSTEETVRTPSPKKSPVVNAQPNVIPGTPKTTSPGKSKSLSPEKSLTLSPEKSKAISPEKSKNISVEPSSEQPSMETANPEPMEIDLSIDEVFIDEPMEEVDNDIFIDDDVLIGDGIDPLVDPLMNTTQPEPGLNTGTRIGLETVVFPCDVCETQFKTFKNLEKHIKSYTKCLTGFAVCVDCKIAFPTRMLLRSHRQTAHIDKFCNYRCNICNQGFARKVQVKQHARHIHGKDVPIIQLPPPPNSEANQDESFNPYELKKCDICSLCFENSEELENHKKIYDTTRVVRCQPCQMVFAGEYLLTQHKKMIHLNAQSKLIFTYGCTICGEGFENDNILNSHMLHVHSWATTESIAEPLQAVELASINPTTQIPLNQMPDISQGCFVCTICKMTFLELDSFMAHLDEFANDGNFQCNMCYKRCRSAQLLENHRKITHMNIMNSTEFKCKICGEILLNKISLNSHEKHFHRKSVNEPPRDPSPQFVSKTPPIPQPTSDSPPVATISPPPMTLSTMMNSSVAAQEQSNKCNVCGINFNDQISLKLHTMEFLNEGNLMCDICGRKFGLSQQLQNHRSKHATEGASYYPFKCNVCNEGFLNFSNLFMHVGHLHGTEALKKYISPLLNKQNAQPVTAKTFNVRLDEKNSPQVKITLNEDIAMVFGQAIAESFSDFYADYPESGRFYEHQCSVCQLVFPDQKSIMKHNIRYYKEGRYLCKMCDKVFTLVAQVEDHRRKHFNINCNAVYTCPICNVRFVSSIAFHAHKAHFHNKQMVNQSKETTEIPEKRPTDTPSPMQNTSINELAETILLEDDSNSGVENQSETNGKNKNKEQRQYTCRICYLSFNAEIGLLKHVTTAHTNQVMEENGKSKEVIDNYFLCGTCQKVFASDHDLQDHEKSCVDKINCTRCTKVFKTEAQLKMHCDLIHNATQNGDNSEQPAERLFGRLKVKSFAKITENPERDCSNSFVIQNQKHTNGSVVTENVAAPQQTSQRQQRPFADSQILSNILTTTQPRPKKADNSSDPRANRANINSEKNSQRTISSYFNGNSPKFTTAFECKLCKETFSHNSQLTQHTYKNCWIFRCFICNSPCLSNEDLHKHVMQHSDIVCQVCGGVFLDSNAFLTHISECIRQVREEFIEKTPKHCEPTISLSRVKEINCGLCKEVFQNVEEATTHLKMQHRVFKCGICQSSYYGKKTLANHIKSAHRLYANFLLYLCEKCKTGFADEVNLKRHVCTESNV